MNIQMRYHEDSEELDYNVNLPPKLCETFDRGCPVTSAASYFKALGHVTRLKCVHLLLELGTLPVGALVDALGESQPNISRHLGYLRGVGLVTSSRREQWILYSLSPAIPGWLLEVIKTSHQRIAGETQGMNQGGKRRRQ